MSSRPSSLARANNLLISIRGGGHNIAGNAVCDDGIMIDMSLMKSVQVDTNARRATVEPGCTLADFDKAAQAHGLATPLGINSTTGVAGLTLGGGFGWLSRKYGMTVDNLISADVVTADGRQVRASEKENADLFWGLRGGGGNFGVVTSFEFQLHPVGPNVLSGLIVYPFDQAKSVLTQFARFTQTMPDELNVWMVTRKAPPLPFLPADVHGKEIVVLALCYAGDPAAGEKLIEPLRKFGTPHRRARRRAAVHRLAAGVRSAAGAGCAQLLEVAQLLAAERGRDRHDHQIRRHAAVAAMRDLHRHDRRPDHPRGARGDGLLEPGCQLRDERARPLGDRPPRTSACIAWAREFFAKSQPFASAGAYINFLTQEETDRIAFAYGGTYQRLVEIKKKYDPTNLFRMNQNIKPA